MLKCIMLHNFKLISFCFNRTTNDDGRCPGLITKQMFIPGVYKMHFDTAQYWQSMGETSFYPYVEVRKPTMPDKLMLFLLLG